MSDPAGAKPPSAEEEPTQLADARAARARTLRTFEPDEVVASRYRIVRFIAQGGMGEVYEAEDAELKERVALKTIRPEVASDAEVLERFKREIHLARQVAHPNVSRIFDLGWHPPGSDASSRVTFLTMELLEGETLTAFLRRRGRLTADEALPLVRQMAAGLDAAHEKGIVHRDFKGGNVLLVPTSRGTRAVVTDFGLARGGAAGEGGASATGAFLGTPAYMAPEQVEGKRATSAADVYALGVVLFEMVTGCLPFQAETPLGAAVKRLKEPPTPPRLLVPSLDPAWEAVILRCLERDPADRFATAGEVAAALGGGSVSLPGREVGRPWKPIAVGAALVAAAGVLLALPLLRSRGEKGPAAGAAAPARTAPHAVSPPVVAEGAPRRSIAVVGFRNLSGKPEAEWMALALSEMLATELAAGQRLRTIPGEAVARMKRDLSIAGSETFAADTLARIRRNLGTDLVVAGTYVVLGGAGKVRVDVRVQDAAAGETVAAVSENGTEEGLLELVARAGASVRAKLGVEARTTGDDAGLRASFPASTEAARLYTEGLEKLRLYDALGGKRLLDAAAAVEPGFALTHAALAEAWAILGHEKRAGEEAKKAFALSAGLPRESRLAVEARYRSSSGEVPKAIEAYRTLYGFFPDSVDYGLRLAELQTSAGKAKDALATVDTLRHLPPPADEDARIDLAEAQAARALSDARRHREAASRAAEKAARQGARQILARARFEEGTAYQNLADVARSRQRLEEARHLFAEAGDRRGVASSLCNLGLLQMNDPAGAARSFQEALAIYRDIGNASGVALVQGNLGNVRYFQGDLEGAKRAWRETLETYRRIEARDGMARMLNNIASVAADQGIFDEARDGFEEAHALQLEIGDRAGAAVSASNLGSLRHGEGEIAAARKRFEESLALWDAIGWNAYTGATLKQLGDMLAAEGDWAGARKRYGEALALYVKVDERVNAGELRVAIAALSLAEGKGAEAAAAAAAAAAELEKADAKDAAAEGRAVEALALLDMEKPAEARAAAARAAALSEKSEKDLLRLFVAVATARVTAASGRPEELRAARARLDEAHARAVKARHVPTQLAARLAMGEVGVRAKDPSAREALRALAREARRRGFSALADRAEKAAL